MRVFESMSERNINPRYYETIQCEKCGTKEDLLMHRYADDIMCVHCVNDLMAEASSEDDDNEDRDHCNHNGMSYKHALEERMS